MESRIAFHWDEGPVRQISIPDEEEQAVKLERPQKKATFISAQKASVGARKTIFILIDFTISPMSLSEKLKAAINPMPIAAMLTTSLFPQLRKMLCKRHLCFFVFSFQLLISLCHFLFLCLQPPLLQELLHQPLFSFPLPLSLSSHVQ